MKDFLFALLNEFYLIIKLNYLDFFMLVLTSKLRFFLTKTQKNLPAVLILMNLSKLLT